MPLNITEENLDNVPAAYRDLYVAKGGNFHLALGDLNSYVAAYLKPLQSELAVVQASERKLLNSEFSAALRAAGIRPNYEKLIIANVGGQISLDTVDGERVITVKDADGFALSGTGPGGYATLTDLAKDAAKQFPSVFPNGASTPGSPSTTNRTTHDDLMKLPPVERMSVGRTRAATNPADDAATASKPVESTPLMKLAPVDRMNAARASKRQEG